MGLYYYNSIDLFRNPENHIKIPGGKQFSYMFHLMGGQFVFYDRTNTLTIPLKYDLLPHLTLPVYEKTTKTFSQLCDERAINLYETAEKNGRSLAIMYSGGIDSTLVVTSMLKNLSSDKLKNITILMNEESLYENKNFFYDHISKNFRCKHSYNYGPYATSDEYMLISGEQADQLFLPNTLFDMLGRKNLPMSYSRSLLSNVEGDIIEFIDALLPDYKSKNSAEHIYFLYQKMCSAAPFKIETVGDMMWWTTLVTKWQSCYYRMLAFAPNVNKVKFEESYSTFFGTHEFQLWSMNNRDSIFEEDFNSYKFIQKKYIYEYNKDDHYFKEKRKNGSLGTAVRRKKPIVYLDNNMNYSYDIPSSEFLNYENDFLNFQ